MSGPAVTTLRKHSPVKSLKASSTKPTLEEVVGNIKVSFGLEADWQSARDRPESAAGGWYLLMWDEIKVQQRLRWMPEDNKIVGLC